MKEKMERYFKLLLAFAVGILICGAISLLMGCRTTRTVQATQTIQSTQTVRRDTVLWRDTVWVKDSVAVWMQGDTVFKERWRTKYADRYVYKVLQDTMIKTDTVRGVVPRGEDTDKMGKGERQIFPACGLRMRSIVRIFAMVNKTQGMSGALYQSGIGRLCDFVFDI